MSNVVCRDYIQTLGEVADLFSKRTSVSINKSGRDTRNFVKAGDAYDAENITRAKLSTLQLALAPASSNV